MDGLPPFFERFMINSVSVVFREWDFFPNPNIRKAERLAMRQSNPEFVEFDLESKLKYVEELNDESTESTNADN
jgi:hypothetical protein